MASSVRPVITNVPLLAHAHGGQNPQTSQTSNPQSSVPLRTEKTQKSRTENFLTALLNALRLYV